MSIRTRVFATLAAAFLLFGAGMFVSRLFVVPLAFTLFVFVVAVRDVAQSRRAILRNFPAIGHMRYLLEAIRPEISQYFIESNTDGRPFAREQRSVVYQRAKRVLDTQPFGTQHDVYEPGYEWLAHSILARPALAEQPRVLVGEWNCDAPYSASLFNIAAMSFGSLSDRAVVALSSGAKLGDFAHNTGEGGVSPYHVAGGGDLIWQIGTGYFGCRSEEGRFDPDRFQQTAAQDQVRMIELKLSQGAKPGHGGILPAAKVTEEIAAIRGVPLGRDVLSPPGHSAFSTPVELLEFLDDLRTLSGGKPVGVKLCVGNRKEFLSLCKAMHESGRTPDYIAIDGGEGGTGAAPLEFANRVGSPLSEGLAFVNDALVGFRLRDRVRLIASGKITNGFRMAKAIALGADLCYAARPMMLALGCIQARLCNSNNCPVGVATQERSLIFGLDPAVKAQRVHHFHHETVHSLLELVAAVGLGSPSELRREHVFRRVDLESVKTYADIFPYLDPGALLFDPVPEGFEGAGTRATA